LWDWLIVACVILLVFLTEWLNPCYDVTFWHFEWREILISRGLFMDQQEGKFGNRFFSSIGWTIRRKIDVQWPCNNEPSTSSSLNSITSHNIHLVILNEFNVRLVKFDMLNKQTQIFYKSENSAQISQIKIRERKTNTGKITCTNWH
jgi:hypothetical protein